MRDLAAVLDELGAGAPVDALGWSDVEDRSRRRDRRRKRGRRRSLLLRYLQP